MNMRDIDLKWLAANFPELVWSYEDQLIAGELRFGAAYDQSSGKLEVGDTDANRVLEHFVRDTFEVKIDVGHPGNNGWPTVYEVGGRRFDIAEQNRCPMVDLHFFEDGACCLGLKRVPERNLTLERFMLQLVVPFFYRLAYTDRYGLTMARDTLWGEYSHGVAGGIEYQAEMLAMAANKPGRNGRCPCGSGAKYKKCHSEEVEAVKHLRMV